MPAAGARDRLATELDGVEPHSEHGVADRTLRRVWPTLTFNASASRSRAGIVLNKSTSFV
eukprot:6297368-Alexandrium_andersonii.AAC.1